MYDLVSNWGDYEISKIAFTLVWIGVLGVVEFRDATIYYTAWMRHDKEHRSLSAELSESPLYDDDETIVRMFSRQPEIDTPILISSFSDDDIKIEHEIEIDDDVMDSEIILDVLSPKEHLRDAPKRVTAPMESKDGVDFRDCLISTSTPPKFRLDQRPDHFPALKSQSFNNRSTSPPKRSLIRSFSKHRTTDSAARLSEFLDWELQMQSKNSIRSEMQAIVSQAKPLGWAIVAAIVGVSATYLATTRIDGFVNHIEGPGVRDMKILREQDLLQSYSPDSAAGSFTDYEYRVFITLSTWLIAMFTGLSLELFLGTHIVQYFETHETMHWFWVYANCLFPIMVLCGFLSQSFFGLPLMVLGMFKFGFPEINAYLHRASTHQMFSIHWWSDSLNGCGSLFHHGSSILVLAGLINELFTLETYVVVILLITLFQHMVVVLKYLRRKTYIVLVLLLELCFQYEILSVLHLTAKDTVFQMACTVLWESHCLYVTAGILESFANKRKPL